MGKQTRSTLQGYFNTGDKPTEQQFADLIDSNLNLNDGGSVSGSLKVVNLSAATASFHTSGSLSKIRFENLPTSYALAATLGSGSLFISGSVNKIGGGKFLCIA
tara:strand:- start:21028 stop:21339 length:312 start_codon:yes stop_codon:yes gene_type:complete